MNPPDPGCPFCQIAAGDQRAQVLEATDSVVAFRDINPQGPTHILLVPREHLTSAAELEDRHGPVLAELFQTATRLARAEGIDRTGWRLVTNTGPDAGQSVHHLHIHLLGGRPLHWPPG